ncbi:MAG: ATP-binding protein [Chlorobium sp.]|nr:MAG: ATP-binding protein [Chlorobium sp.]
MLIEFRVKNFRSIREEQRLSLVANSDKEHSETHIVKGRETTGLHILKSAVIYGANASGKSNLVSALLFMQQVVAESATLVKEGEKFFLQPFRLDNESPQKPTEFEITFVLSGVRYQYGFALLPERIVEEWLLVYSTSKPQIWFNRQYNPETNEDDYKFSSHLSGEKKLWQKSTRSNALFLSKAVDLNSNALRPVFLWIVQHLYIIGAGHQPLLDYSTKLAKSPEGQDQLLCFLNAADLSIADVSLERGKKKDSETDALIPVFLHKASDGSAKFEIQEESAGTQRLFAFAGPILDILDKGSVLVVDELDGSLHTMIVRFLLSIINSSKHNAKGAQLIFTTHDTSIMDTDILRRDQFWFVEKNQAQATQLYPLTDFSPRKKEALERGYLIGRYGAIPFLNDFKIPQ